MGSQPSPGSRRRSWRRPRSLPQSGGGTRTPRRVFATILLVVLCALFAWIIYRFVPQRGGRTFEHVAVSDYDLLALPALPFASQDHADLQSLRGFRQPPQFRLNLDTRLFRAFCGSLSSKGGESLAVYVSAQGVSEGGAAYLACPDFARDGRSGRVAVRELLLALQQSPAESKLLLLDACRIPFDPGLGMAINEFSRLVIEDTIALGKDAQNVWVLLSAKPFQASGDAYAERRSIFGLAVKEALSGLANQPRDKEVGSDGDGDRFVTLYELYYYVSSRCAHWYEGDRQDIAQTPILLRGGEGFVPLDSQVFADRTGKYRQHRLKVLQADEVAVEGEADGKQEEGEQKGTGQPKPGAKGTTASRAAARLRAGRPAGLAWLQPGPAAAPAVAEGETKKPPGEPRPDGAAATQQAKTLPPGPAEKSGSGPPASELKPPGTAPPEPAPKKPEPPVRKAAKPDPQKEYLALLEQAWSLRDQLQQRGRPTLLSPIGFAPDLWRETEAHLLDYEQCFLGGYADMPASAGAMAEGSTSSGAPIRWRSKNADSLRELVSSLQRLQKSMAEGAPLEPAPSPRVEGDRLLAAWAHRLETWQAEERTWEAEESELAVAFRDVLREFASLAYAAPYYVRWHARASFFSSGELEFRPLIVKYLDGLRQFRDALRNVERASEMDVSAVNSPSGLDPSLDLQPLQTLKGQLDARLGEFLRAHRKNISQRVAQANLAVLLSTPLLPARDRLGAVRDLASLPPVPPPLRFLGPPANVVLRAQPGQWEGLLAHVQLEQQLARLAAPQERLQLDRIKALMARYDPEKDEPLWVEYRRLGAEMRDVGAEILALAREPQMRRQYSDLAIYLVDPRYTVPRCPFPEFDFNKFKQKPLIRIAAAGESRSINVWPDRETAVAFEVRATTAELSAVPLRPAFDPALIDARIVDAGTSQKAGGVYRRTVTCHVLARQSQQPDRGSAPLRLEPSVPGTPCEAAEVICRLPNPDRIDLLATREGVERPEPEVADSVILRLFPGHTTRYGLRLRNQSDRPKNVKVELYAVPELPGHTRAPGKLPARLQDQLRSGAGLLSEKLTARLLGRIEKLALEPRGARDHPLIFPPAASKAVPSEPKPAAPPPAQEVAPGPSPVDVSHGLLCLITDLDAPGKPAMVKWLEIEPRYPSQYLTAEAEYLARSERLVVRLRPSAGEDIPRDAPVKVSWEKAELARSGIPPRGRLEGQIRSQEEILELYAALAPDGKERYVRLSVDGCPRAFIFRVVCKGTAGGDGVSRGVSCREDTNETEITSISVPGQPQVYHVEPYPDLPDEKEEAKQKAAGTVHIRLQENQPAVFRGASALRIRFRSDARNDFRGERDSIAVYLRNEEKIKLHSDRQMTARLVKFGEQGDLDLRLDLSDHVVELDPQETNRETRLQTAVIVDERTRARSTPVRVIMDSQPPKIGLHRVDGRITKGQPLLAEISVEDISPIAEVRYAFLARPPRQLDEENSFSVPPGEAGRNRLAFAMDAARALDVGHHTWWVQVWDQAGWKSELLSGPLEVVLPAKPILRGTVYGDIKLPSGRNVNGLQFQGAGDVTLWQGETLAGRPVEVRSDGSFLIRDLPAGKYTIKVRGSVSGKSVATEDTREFTFDDPNKAGRETWVVVIK